MWCPARLCSWASPFYIVHSNTWQPSLVKRYELSLLFVDGSSLYLIVHPHDIESAVSRVEGCVALVQKLMELKSLLLNSSKTELLLITSKTIYKKLVCPTISICDTLIEPSEMVKMIGELLDKHITVEQHVTSACRATHYHL